MLRKDGTLWLNLGDSYAGSGKGAWANKHGGQKEVYIPDSDSPQSKIPKVPAGMKAKDLVGIPWMVAFALRSDGWYLRSDIIWHKPNVMPANVSDRPTKSHEYLFLLSKSRYYYYNCEAVKEDASGDHPGGKRNRRTVWTINSQPYKGAHFATFPEKLVEPCILAGSKPGDTIIDPFSGSGTTGAVSLRYGRNFLGIELNPEYIQLAHERISKETTPTTVYEVGGSAEGGAAVGVDG